MDKNKIRIIGENDSAYPERLRSVTGRPSALYVYGDLPDDGVPTAAIVGARMCSGYGRATAYEFGRVLAKNGVQIISGMAAGIDSSSQEGALDAGGKSFAVLGNGVDICYPRQSSALYRRLMDEGGLISEQPPGTKPLPYYFPERNRIISALADVVIVVEAKARSGSLITVDFALAQGRSVFAVPGRVGDELSDGCNYLIAQGAGIAYAPKAILDELKLISDTKSFAAYREHVASFRRARVRQVRQSETLSEQEKRIFLALEWENALTPDRIAEKTKYPAETVRAALCALAREGLAQEEAPDIYIRSRRLSISYGDTSVSR
ncbi:MAG: DNA-processing protein DprA [Lachnospiraceae bacterium]|nr:DNA-processing protein DprA [Lachnospiraceae bacterium]